MDMSSYVSSKRKSSLQLYLTSCRAKALINQRAALAQGPGGPPKSLGTSKELGGERLGKPGWWWGQGPSRGSLVPLWKASLVPTPRTENVSRFCHFLRQIKKKKRLESCL